VFKRLLSYIIPINLLKINSKFSQTLEVTLTNGELVLDSKNTNYSYGSLQRILRYGLKKIGFSQIEPMQNILVLGVAGGSVIKTLVEEIKCKGQITGIELDEKVIQLANDYFQLNTIKNLKVLHGDAFEFVLRTKNKYDLIIVDIFQDTLMPTFLFETYFQDRLYDLLNNKGYILFNTMIFQSDDNLRNQSYANYYNSKKINTCILTRIEEHNELIIIEKVN
jgi:predicted membrane-bound spermidine synthase